MPSLYLKSGGNIGITLSTSSINLVISSLNPFNLSFGTSSEAGISITGALKSETPSSCE